MWYNYLILALIFSFDILDFTKIFQNKKQNLIIFLSYTQLIYSQSYNQNLVKILGSMNSIDVRNSFSFSYNFILFSKSLFERLSFGKISYFSIKVLLILLFCFNFGIYFFFLCLCCYFASDLGDLGDYFVFSGLSDFLLNCLMQTNNNTARTGKSIKDNLMFYSQF